METAKYLAVYFLFGRSENIINQFDGFIFLSIFIYFLYLSFFKSEHEKEPTQEQKTKSYSLVISVMLIVAGGAGLFVGGKWIISGVSQLSVDLGVSESVLGLTLIAGATSLPELVTTIVAPLQKNTDIAIGNAIGSNIFNIFLVLGVSAVIKPINYNLSLNVQIGFLVFFSLVLMLFIQTGKTRRTISRKEGILLIFGYFCFLYYSIYVN